MTDKQEFYNEKMGVPWEPDPILTAVRAAVDEYHESCDAYDKAVCGDIAIQDGTDEQRRLVNRNARLKRENLLRRISWELQLTRKTAENYWREAMGIWRRK